MRKIDERMATNYITVHNGVVEAKLDVYIYKNDGFQIAYSPALDLMGYGKTIKDAKASFEVVIEDFFEFSIKNGTLNEYLMKHAWVATKKSVEFVPPKNTQLMESNQKFQDIFNSDFRKLSLPVNYAITPC